MYDNDIVLGVPIPPLGFSNSLGGLKRFRVQKHSTVAIHYSERIQSKVSSGEQSMRRLWRRDGLLPVGSHKTHWIPQALNCDHACEMSTRGPITDSVPKVFIWGWSCRQPLPSTYQNSRLLKGKQVFSTNPAVCTDRHSVSHSFYQLGNWETPPQIKDQTPARINLTSRPF